MRKILFTSLLLLASGLTFAQTDKAEADRIVYQMLTSGNQTENWHPGLVILNSQLEETAEKGIFIVKGDSFQIKSLRSDFYVQKKGNDWIPLNDPRFPMETMVNLLLNRIADNRHRLDILHHQYGGHKPRIILPMQDFFDLLSRNMRLYCSVNFIDKNEMRAILVFHQQHFNFIHLLELKVKTGMLTDPISTVSGDLYTNIPQDNINNLFREGK